MLKGKTIHIRTVRRTDMERYIELMSDLANRGPYFPQALESEATYMERFEKSGYWSEERGAMLIVDNKSKRIVGQLVFFKPVIFYDAYEIGYIIFDEKDRGKGYTTQAVDLFMSYLFNWKNVFRLQIQLETPNTGSRRVAEKAGFTHEGTARQAMIRHGKPVDLQVYSMTRDEFDRRSAKPGEKRKSKPKSD